MEVVFDSYQDTKSPEAPFPATFSFSYQILKHVVSYKDKFPVLFKEHFLKKFHSITVPSLFKPLMLIGHILTYALTLRGQYLERMDLSLSCSNCTETCDRLYLYEGPNQNQNLEI